MLPLLNQQFPPRLCFIPADEGVADQLTIEQDGHSLPFEEGYGEREKFGH